MSSRIYTFLLALLTFTCLAADSDTARLNDPAFLKGYWPLSKDALDYSGNGNHGSWSGTEAYQAGPFGKDNALVSSASTSAFLLSSYTTNINVPLTISFWTKDKSKIASVSYPSLFNGFSAVLNAGITLFQSSASSKYELRMGLGTTYSGLTSGFSNVVDSSQIVMVVTSTNKLIYLNGRLNASNSHSGTFALMPFVPGLATYTTNQFSNVRLYNVALSSSEVSALYKLEQSVPKYSPSPIADPTCQLWLWNGQDLAQGRTITNYKVQTGNGVHKLNGSEGAISTPDCLGTNDFTVLAWVKPKTAGGSNSGYIFGNYWDYLQFNGSLNSITYTSNQATYNTLSETFIANAWKCVVVTRAYTNSQYYINGNYKQSGNSGTPGSVTPGSSLAFGAWYNTTNYRTFDGSLGHVIIWSRVLPAAEIKDVYDSLKIYY